MGTVELLAHGEKAAWSAYMQSQKTEDLDRWRAALGRLNDELQARVRLLTQGVQTSAGYRP